MNNSELSILNSLYTFVLVGSIAFNVIQCDLRKEELTVHDAAFVKETLIYATHHARIIGSVTKDAIKEVDRLNMQIYLNKSKYFELNKWEKVNKKIQGKTHKVHSINIKKGVKALDKFSDRFWFLSKGRK